MSSLPMCRVVCVLLAVSSVLASACTQQGEKGAEPPPGEAGTRVAHGQSAAVSDAEWEALSEQSRVERSFVRFLEGLRNSRVEGLSWDEASWERVDDLYQPYHRRALALSGMLSETGATDPADAGDVRGNAARIRQELLELRTLRFSLSRAVAEHVFGLDPDDNTEFGDAVELDAIGTGREPAWREYIGKEPGREPSRRQARIISEMRQVFPRASDEFSFGMFLEALRGGATGSTDINDRWGEVIDLFADYKSTATVYGDILWPFIQPMGLRQSPSKMREVLDMCKRELPELRQQRFNVSRSLLEDVFGIEDQGLLQEVGTGQEE